jgi:hypothetical protein
MPTLRLPALSALAALPTPEQAVSAGPCVVPLLEMAIPTDDRTFPIRRAQPLVTDKMKMARGLPACPAPGDTKARGLH